MTNPEVTQKALSMLRSPANFHWEVVIFLAFVLYVYSNELEKKNYKAVVAGLALYMVHWFVEILNAVIQHVWGHALWTAPAGTDFLILVGVGIEISMMFSVAGLITSKLLPPDKNLKILGIPNRWVFIVGNAAFVSFLEIFLVRTPVFAWVYDWWGSLTVFITVYIPFFAAAFLLHDAQPSTQKKWLISMVSINLLMGIVFGPVLKWI